MTEIQTIQMRSDTADNWNTHNQTPAEGEICYNSTTKKLKVGDGLRGYKALENMVLDTELDETIELAHKLNDKVYEGEVLEEKFADEIAQVGDTYTWLDSIKGTDMEHEVHTGDKFSVPMSAGTVAGTAVAAQTFTARIVGKNTYKNCGDTPIGNMFYCKADQAIHTPFPWNPTNNNNGTANQAHPWLASAAYAVLNGVNNYTTSAYGSAAHGADASSGGILQLLPAELQAVLKQKRMLLDSRYSASGLLTGGTSWDWLDGGKLWCPNEYEVYGCAVRSNLCQTEEFWHPEAGLSIQFPWFANNCEHRILTNANGDRVSWWLSSAASYGTTIACNVYSSGYANSNNASYSSVCLPLCFCI